jgi:hypothetical protein
MRYLLARHVAERLTDTCQHVHFSFDTHVSYLKSLWVPCINPLKSEINQSSILYWTICQFTGKRRYGSTHS